jgi:hypothetical protein
VWRSRPDGAVGFVIPMTVVEDAADVTVLFQATGSVCKKRAGVRGGPGRRLMLPGAATGEHLDAPFAGPPMLRLHVWGTEYTVLRSWRFDEGRADGWYVNLEAGWRRTPIGFDSEDHVLDVTVADDLTSCMWKDEDELAWSVEVAKYTREKAAAIRAEGERVMRAIEHREWPFHDDWSRWRPDEAWPTAVLPADWRDHL